MEFVKNNIGKWASALVLLVVGILCIVAGAAGNNYDTKADAYKAISITIGVALLIVACLVLVLALIATIVSKGETKFGVMAIAVSVTLAMGIFFVSKDTLGAELIALFLSFIPYLLIVTGSIIAVDAILTLVFALINKKNVKVTIIAVVCAFVFAIIAIVLGALMIGDNPVISKDVQFIVFGIILIISAALAALASFVNLPTPNKKDDKVIDAEVKDAE